MPGITCFRVVRAHASGSSQIAPGRRSLPFSPRKFRMSKLVSALILLAGASLLYAQESRATLGGRVSDAQGAVIPSAEVIVTAEATGVKQPVTSNQQGYWLVQFLVPGSYSVSIASPGF